MDAETSIKLLVSSHKTTRLHIREDSNMNIMKYIRCYFHHMVSCCEDVGTTYAVEVWMPDI
jgi:hypothetical protein